MSVFLWPFDTLEDSVVSITFYHLFFKCRKRMLMKDEHFFTSKIVFYLFCFAVPTDRCSRSRGYKMCSKNQLEQGVHRKSFDGDRVAQEPETWTHRGAERFSGNDETFSPVIQKFLTEILNKNYVYNKLIKM